MNLAKQEIETLIEENREAVRQIGMHIEKLQHEQKRKAETMQQLQNVLQVMGGSDNMAKNASTGMAMSCGDINQAENRLTRH